MIFTSFLLERMITATLAAASGPATDYSSASYALAVATNSVEGLSTGRADFGMLWIADLAASIDVIAGFV
jgi:hypothetical protein